MLSDVSTELSEQFKQIELTHSHAKVYHASLELGTAPASQIAKKTGLPRSTVYGLLNDLVGRGLVSRVQGETKAVFSPAPPSKLLYLLKSKASKVQQSYSELKDTLDDLESIYNSHLKNAPKVRFYQGEQGLRFALFDTFSSNEVLWMCSGDIKTQSGLEKDPEYLREYIEESVFRRQPTRELLQDTPSAREYYKKYAGDEKQVILIPQRKDCKIGHVDKIIHNDKLTYISHDNLKAVIIEDQTISQAEREHFETLWTYWELQNTRSDNKKELTN